MISTPVQRDACRPLPQSGTKKEMLLHALVTFKPFFPKLKVKTTIHNVKEVPDNCLSIAV